MVQFGPIGECIYCGDRSSKLSNEHIIPYGLGGKDVLLKASCKKCQAITSKCELTVLRKELFQIRTKLGLPSRKSTFPKELPLVVKLGKNAKTFHLPTARHPTFAIFLEYPPPGALGGDVPEKGMNIIGSQLWHIGGPPIKETLHSLGSKEFEVSYTSYGNEFEKMLAKIAYGYAIAIHGLDAVRSSPLKQIILGTSERIGYWIGMGDPTPQVGKTFNRVRLEKTNGWLLAKIILFSGMPEYVVVILEGEQEDKPSSCVPVLLATNLGNSTYGITLHKPLESKQSSTVRIRTTPRVPQSASS